jgi:outer membrane protein
MKIANIVINVILGAAVVVLFVFHFSGDEKGIKGGERAASAALANPGEISIAYFNMDSVMSQWELYFEYQQDLSQKQTELEADFAGRTETFYQSVQDAQYKIQKGLVTRTESEQLQQQLAAEEQSLQALQNQYAAQIQEEGMVKNRQMLDRIETYVAELSATQGYSYVYSYTFGGNLIYGAKSNDITAAVVLGLNEKYQEGSAPE